MITYTNVLDAAGQTLQTIRIGTNGSSIITYQAQYDQAGNLVRETNALGGLTTHTRTNASTGGLVLTTVNPDGGTRVEAYYADGALKSITGTAVHGVGYETLRFAGGGRFAPEYIWSTRLDRGSGEYTFGKTRLFVFPALTPGSLRSTCHPMFHGLFGLALMRSSVLNSTHSMASSMRGRSRNLTNYMVSTRALAIRNSSSPSNHQGASRDEWESAGTACRVKAQNKAVGAFK